MEQVDGPNTGRVVVIIVDDEPDIAREIADGLSADGIEAQIAHSAEEALAHMRQAGGAVGVVVTDLKMPGLDGFGLIARLREDPTGEMPEILLMSGHASPDERRRAMQAGVSAVLRKPFAWAEFSDAINGALDRARSRRETAATATAQD